MKTLIIGSGCLTDLQLIRDHYSSADLVIAADGGENHLNNAGLKPHVLLGDFDSISVTELEKIRHRNEAEIITFPSRKDYTDMELALELAIERGATEIVLLGASGSRLDHTTANIHLLYKLLKKGIKGYIEDEHNRIYLINRSLTIKKQDNRKVSLLPLPPAAVGITTRGLSYALSDAAIEFGTGQGISNEFNQETATISIKEGLLLVFISKD